MLYDQTSTHSQASHLGVGISGYGLSAGYSSGGTNTSTATRGEDFARPKHSAWFRTEFRDGQFRGYCYLLTPDVKVPRAHQHSPCPTFWWPPGVGHTKTERRFIHSCYWNVMSTGWDGGATDEKPHAGSPRAPAANCVTQSRGTDFHYDTGTAVNWSSGYSLGLAADIKGVNLHADFSTNAQTGYDANALMKFEFHLRGKICGTNTGPYNSAILVARGHG